MSTVALSMIVKDEYDQILEILNQACHYFTEINIVVSDKPTANKLKKLQYKDLVGGLNIKWREWNDRFDEAREVSREMCTTDYMFWLDADDSFNFKAIPSLVERADERKLDAIFLPYEYAYDEDGNCITFHWRERLVRLDKGFAWKGWVHETLISDEKYNSSQFDVPVKHLSDANHARESQARNQLILEKAYAETDDPRYALYLGMGYYAQENYEKCATVLMSYLEIGGSVEDSYRAMSIISECAYHLGQHELALEYATKCMTLKPEYPMGYWLLAQYEADQNNWAEALEWVKTAELKPDPQTLSVYDPTARSRAVLIAAQAEFMLGEYNNALSWLRKIPGNKHADDLYPDFLKEADAESFINLLPKFRQFFKSDEDLWKALAPDIAYDKRIQSLRFLVNKPKVWDDNSIVILCGAGYEEWGPSTLDKGMGGSEEAVVYLTRELAKLGWNVTVYGEVDEVDMTDSGIVDWRPWQRFDKRDDFNVFVAWRSPQYAELVKARVKLVDVHDVLPETAMKDIPDTTYLVKTNYHRSLTPLLADDKFRIIGNGIKKDQFSDHS